MELGHKRILVTVAAVSGLASAYLSGQQEAAVVGSPLPGITARELELFRLGREDFLEVETPEEGLGPTFNGTSCAQCHNIPAVGGTSAILEVRAGRRDADGKFYAPPGGTLVHLFSVAPHTCQVSVYDEANVIAHRISIPLFGVGLVEAIPDATLLALEDPEDKNGDGIRGRAAIIEDVATGKRRVGRFGWKAQQATLLAFAADAYFNEMGITNDLFHNEGVLRETRAKPSPCDATSASEDVRNPRTGLRGIDDFENFLKLLAPPPRGAITSEVTRGERVFTDIGCAGCHIPQLETGPSSNPLFDRKPVKLFSDVLLHNIGTGDGIEQAAARGDEIRTPSLWGLRFRRPLLHDGSAASLEQAISRHQREAAGASERFAGLPAEQKSELLAFLRSL
jgi:CxxC motif-containing protein (DUF1111 family)